MDRSQNHITIRGYIRSHVWSGKFIRYGRKLKNGIYRYFVTLKTENLITETDFTNRRINEHETTEEIELIVFATANEMDIVKTYYVVQVEGRLIIKRKVDGFRKDSYFIECRAKDITPIRPRRHVDDVLKIHD